MNRRRLPWTHRLLPTTRIPPRSPSPSRLPMSHRIPLVPLTTSPSLSRLPSLCPSRLPSPFPSRLRFPFRLPWSHQIPLERRIPPKTSPSPSRLPMGHQIPQTTNPPPSPRRLRESRRPPRGLPKWDRPGFPGSKAERLPAVPAAQRRGQTGRGKSRPNPRSSYAAWDISVPRRFARCGETRESDCDGRRKRKNTSPIARKTFAPEGGHGPPVGPTQCWTPPKEEPSAPIRAPPDRAQFSRGHRVRRQVGAQRSWRLP
jgi:hypothetical protein